MYDSGGLSVDILFNAVLFFKSLWNFFWICYRYKILREMLRTSTLTCLLKSLTSSSEDCSVRFIQNIWFLLIRNKRWSGDIFEWFSEDFGPFPKIIVGWFQLFQFFTPIITSDFLFWSPYWVPSLVPCQRYSYEVARTFLFDFWMLWDLLLVEFLSYFDTFFYSFISRFNDCFREILRS